MAMIILAAVGRWYVAVGAGRMRARKARSAAAEPLPRRTVQLALAVLIALTFSKFVYTASFSSYFSFFLIEKFRISVAEAQIYMFIFLAAVAVGTIIGGPIGDRIGRKTVILISIFGVLPLSLLIPHLPLVPTVIVSALTGLILASAFPAIIVFAQELLPSHVGTVAGLFFGLAFGMGAIGAAALGQIADARGIVYVYGLCAFLPAIGSLAVFLPNLKTR